MCVKFPPRYLNPGPYPPHPTSTYTYGVTIAQRMCGDGYRILFKSKNPCQIKIHLMREMLEINSHVYYFDSLAIVRKKHIRLAI